MARPFDGSRALKELPLTHTTPRQEHWCGPFIYRTKNDTKYCSIADQKGRSKVHDFHSPFPKA
eukprot:5690363-Karenia_brevis.AAC.1